MNDKTTSLSSLQRVVSTFCEDRDWGQYHNPKDLAIMITTEAAELLSIFRYKDEADIEKIFVNKKEAVEDELADILFGLLRFAELNNIDLSQSLESKIGKVNQSELRSWENSLLHMYMTLDSPDIPNDAGVAIEFNIPNTSKRVDFIISGKDDAGKSNLVIVELKQWETATVVENKDGIIKTYLGGGIRETTHPSYQAWTYASYIGDYNEEIYSNDTQLAPCSFLHNYKEENRAALMDETYSYYIKQAPVFIKGERNKLTEFIKKHVKYGDHREGIYRLENGKIKPSKSLQDALSSMLEGNEEFLMLDEQKVVYETALDMAMKSYKDHKKRVLIIEGGPGTGKSVVAINLLVKLTGRDMVCQYITKNSAHRLNRKSGMFKNLGENQIKEIIHSSKFSIFFIDEHQQVHIDDYGNVADIIKFSKAYNGEYEKMELLSQFRCSGSDGYIAWLDHVLEIRETANFDGFDDKYDFQIMDSPQAIYETIRDRNHNNKARMLAGYCWGWDSKKRNDTSHGDIEIDDFKMSWNLDNTSTWAIDPESVNEIGCIHTSQGLEFEYAGVIIGEDLRYVNGEIITDFTKRAVTDRSLFGIKKRFKENPEDALALADGIIKNTYRTLMSRGQKGCYVYCVDKGLGEYLKERLRVMKQEGMYEGVGSGNMVLT
ncbi:MAG TPA: DUF2075 domain-containing protein [Epulopiscium sp.]|nr:DUF2075 domain-containing protein [Candidatus Epulonipiscium sp.]